MQNTEINQTNPKESVNTDGCVSAEELSMTASDSTPAEENSSACLSASCGDCAPEERSLSDKNEAIDEAPLATGDADEAFPTEEEGDEAVMAENEASPTESEDAQKPHTPDEEGVGDEDFALQAEADMCELCALFPTLSPDGRALSLGELANPTRFAELRAAGLTVEEAFLASNYRMLTKASPTPLEGGRGVSHMKGALPRSAGGGHAMPSSLLVRTRTIFEGLSDKELTSLYHRVTQ